MTTAIVWFRRDLRLADNAALAHALRDAPARVIPAYVHAPGEAGDVGAGGASLGLVAASQPRGAGAARSSGAARGW
ncbi:MAG: deoxyribodipyrimidine photo-lyase [Comamonadaceae bacterium]|nr:deoxyribodipyrimidine photo-lyase [Comamonadaceae bacterium]